MKLNSLRLICLSSLIAFVTPPIVVATTPLQDFESFTGDVDFPAGTNTFPSQSPGELGFAIHPALNVRSAGIRSVGLAGGVQQRELQLAGHAVELMIDDPLEISFRFSKPAGKEYVVINNEATQPDRFTSRYGLNLLSAILNSLGTPTSHHNLLYQVDELVDGQSYEIKLQFDPDYLLLNPDLRIESFHVVNDGTVPFHIDDFRVKTVPEPSSMSFVFVALLLCSDAQRLRHRFAFRQ